MAATSPGSPRPPMVNGSGGSANRRPRGFLTAILVRFGRTGCPARDERCASSGLERSAAARCSRHRSRRTPPASSSRPHHRTGRRSRNFRATAERNARRPQLRRFIKSRPYVPMHELRRRFGIVGDDDDVTPVRIDPGMHLRRAPVPRGRPARRAVADGGDRLRAVARSSHADRHRGLPDAARSRARSVGIVS